MKKIAVLLVFLFGGISSNSAFAAELWTRVGADLVSGLTPVITSSQSLAYMADEGMLKSRLATVSSDPAKALLLELPMPDGSMRTFRVWQTSMLPDELAEKYPAIKTFTAELIGNPLVTAKLDFTLYGFHAMIFDGDKTSMVDPYDNSLSGFYLVHYKKDEVRKQGVAAKCFSQPGSEPATRDRPMDISPSVNKGNRTGNGQQLRIYRLALACSHQYAVAATSIAHPLVSQVLSKMVTSMNRVNGVYERELSITMAFVAKEDTLIFPEATGDPFGGIDSDPGACLFANQTLCDNRIGTLNYDMGHVFTTNAGGLSEIGVICQLGSKAQSVTGQPIPVGDGFDIDFVVHELGHEFGAVHTFNGKDGNCRGVNIDTSAAYEPGSGSTIMAYAGICSPDDLQPHSDDYFHAASLDAIHWYITNTGSGCGAKSPTNNKLVSLASFAATYNIPFLTPFELTAPEAIDSVADTLTTYCWEEWDKGSFSTRLVNTHAGGPIFRSYHPSKSQTRVFPKDTMVLAGTLSDAGHENKQGEKVPDVERVLSFKLTVRDIFQGKGCFLFPDDKIVLNAINTGEGFAVTSQGDTGAIYIGGTAQTITWNVVGSNTSPINAQNVDIYMSDDGGYHWPYHIGTFPNNGIASVPLPNPDVTIAKARIKVKGSGNVFFNVNKSDFSVTHGDGTDTTIRLFPVPASTTLRISTGNKGQQAFDIFNSVGRHCYSGTVYGIYDVDVHLWPRDMYFIRMIDVKKHRTVMKFVVQ